MTCQELIRCIDAFLDNELSVMETLKVQGHLAFCGSCRTVVESEAKLKALIETEALQDVAPAHLRERILRAIEEEPAREGRRRRASSLRLVPLLGLLAGAAVAGLLLTLTLQSAREGSSLNTEVVRQHLTVSGGETALEIASQDPSQIASWLQTRLGFPIKLPPLARPGERLIGARLSSIANVKAAQLIYEWAGRKTSLFIFEKGRSMKAPADLVREVEGVEFSIAEYQGHSVVWWEDQEVYYAVASDAGVDDLVEFGLICVKGKEI